MDLGNEGNVNLVIGCKRRMIKNRNKELHCSRNTIPYRKERDCCFLISLFGLQNHLSSSKIRMNESS